MTYNPIPTSHVLFVRILVEKALHEEILPPNPDDAARTDRLLNVMSLLNEKQWKGYVNVLERQVAVVKEVEIFVALCEKYNVGILLRRLLVFLRWRGVGADIRCWFSGRYCG